MNKKEYLKKSSNVLFGNLIIEEKKNIKLHLVTPFKKKPKSSFSLIINGLYFVKTKGLKGFILYEFIKSLNDYSLHDQKALIEISNNVSNTITEIFTKEFADDIKNELFLMIEEIKRIVKNEKPKGIFNVVYPISYSMHYRRAFGIKIAYSNNDNLKKIYDDYSLMQKNGIFTIMYDEKYMNDSNFTQILSLKNSFYQMVKSNSFLSTIKELESYKNAGLDLIQIDILELDKNYLPTKNILNFIKLCLNAGLKVRTSIYIESNSIDYLKIIQTIHNLGVKSFEISFNDNVENKTSIFKRLYFYLNIYHLEVSLKTDGVIKEKELKRMNVDASYKENMTSWYYYNFSDDYYLDEELSLNNPQLFFLSGLFSNTTIKAFF